MEALLVLAALVVWLLGLLTLTWVLPALLVVLAAAAADKPATGR